MAQCNNIACYDTHIIRARLMLDSWIAALALTEEKVIVPCVAPPPSALSKDIKAS